MLIPALSVVENVVLGTKNKKRGLLDLGGAAEALVSLAGQYNMSIDPWARVSQLTVGQQQRLEILKALYKGADLLILDEPTAVLTPQEVEELFLMIKKLTGENHTVIFISHKLNEIMAVCERVTVLRQGETVKTLDAKDTDSRALARLMIGRDLSAAIEKKPLALKNKILEVRELNCFNSKGVRAIKNISFDLRGGEILGVAGVDGNGQRELVDAITGLCPIESGHILINGYDITNHPPREILEYKVAHIPEDRHKRGIVLPMTVKENMILMNYYKEPVSKRKILRGDVIDSIYEGLLKKYQIKSSGGDEPIKNLSGGNQQKVVLARELSKSPDLLVAMYPMRGLDVGASEYIRGRLLEERDRGCAVLLISTELEEIISLSDRICVLYEGEIMGELPASGADIHQIGLMMAGAKREFAVN
jgi:simple sugar transport system ATP-binding protein